MHRVPEVLATFVTRVSAAMVLSPVADQRLTGSHYLEYEPFETFIDVSFLLRRCHDSKVCL